MTTSGLSSRTREDDHAFNALWLGQTIAAVGDAFTMLAFPLLVIAISGSILHLTLITAVGGVGTILGGAIGGPIVDRLPRLRVLLVCDVARGALLGSIPLMHAAGVLSLATLYAVSLAMSILATVGGIGFVAFVPEIVEKEKLARANARIDATIALSFLAGPILAGMVSARFGPPVAIAVDAIGFGISAIVLATLALRRRRLPPQRSEHDRGVLAGLRHVVADPFLRWLLILKGLAAFPTAAVIDLLVVRMKMSLHYDDRSAGLAFAAAALGSVAGAALAPWTRRRNAIRTFLFCAFGAMAIGLLGVSRFGDLAFLCLCTCLFSLAHTMVDVVLLTLRQEIVPTGVLGRVSGLFSIATNLAIAGGAAAAGPLAERHGVELVLALVGVLMVPIAMLAVFVPRMPSPRHV